MGLVVITKDSQLKVILSRVGNAMGHSCSFFDDPEAAINHLDKTGSDKIFLMDTEYMENLSSLPKEISLKPSFISIGSRFYGDLLPHVSDSELGKCYLSKSSPYFEENLINQIHHLDKDISIIPEMNVESVPWKVERIKSTDQISKSISEMQKYIGTLSFSPHTSNMLKMVANEMLANAVFNSPEFEGKDAVAMRLEEFSIDGNRDVLLKYHYDGRKFSIICEDGNGTLSFDSIFSNLKRCFETKGRVRRSSQASGGIGFYMILNIMDEVWIRVERNKKTTCMGCLYPPEIYQNKRKAKEVHSFCYIKV